MGCTVDFACEACGYRAHVSGGGDAGFIAVTQTFVCTDCQMLFDAVVSQRPQEDSGDWQPVAPHCPQRRAHTIAAWQHPGACPRCVKEPMEPDPQAVKVLWD